MMFSLLLGFVGGLCAVYLPKVYQHLKALKRLKTESHSVKLIGDRSVRYDGDRPVAVCLSAKIDNPVWLPPSKFAIKTKEDAKKWLAG